MKGMTGKRLLLVALVLALFVLATAMAAEKGHGKHASHHRRHVAVKKHHQQKHHQHSGTSSGKHRFAEVHKSESESEESGDDEGSEESGGDEESSGSGSSDDEGSAAGEESGDEESGDESGSSGSASSSGSGSSEVIQAAQLKKCDNCAPKVKEPAKHETEVAAAPMLLHRGIDAKIVPNFSHPPGFVRASVLSTQHISKEEEALTAAEKEDPTLRKLIAEKIKGEADIVTAQNWVQRIHGLIEHYRMKIGQTEINIRNKKSSLQKLKVDIEAAKRAVHQRMLQEKLSKVSKELSTLHAQANKAAEKATALRNVKGNLYSNIEQLRRQIQSLHSQTAAAANPNNSN